MSEPATTPGRWLEQTESGGTIQAPAHLWGFGALHGGLTLAALTQAMRQVDDEDEDSVVRSVTGRLHRRITGAFTITTTQPRHGRAAADALDHATGTIKASASLVTSPARSTSFPVLAPCCPTAAPVDECEPFLVPPEFVPISAFTQVRPVGPDRPYAGGEHPELTAWVRLTEDDRPPDLRRMIVLLDALAPSYAAILAVPYPIPTVELTVRPARQLDQATSPWVLLHATTTSAAPDGWLHERIDAFDPTGIHLASADQLRTVAPSSPTR